MESYCNMLLLGVFLLFSRAFGFGDGIWAGGKIDSYLASLPVSERRKTERQMWIQNGV